MRIIYEFDDSCKNIVYVPMGSIREALAEAVCKKLDCTGVMAAYRLGIRRDLWAQWKCGIRKLPDAAVQKVAGLLGVDEWLVNK